MNEAKIEKIINKKDAIINNEEEIVIVDEERTNEIIDLKEGDE